MQRVISVDSNVNLGQGAGGGEQVGTLPTQIVTEATAGQVAKTLSHPCGSCKHFDNPAWLKTVAASDSPLAPKSAHEALNGIRAQYMMSNDPNIVAQFQGADGDFDAEAALRANGYCHALMSYSKATGDASGADGVIVTPFSTCPEEVCTPTSPHGFYQPRDRAARRIATKAYDNILNRASGKKA